MGYLLRKGSVRLISTNRTHYPDIPGLVNFKRKSLILSIVRKITLIDLAGYPVCGTSTEILISAFDSWVTAVTQGGTTPEDLAWLPGVR